MGAYYDYGENVTYDDGTVYYGDQPVASAEQYYAQAGQIADSGQEPPRTRSGCPWACSP